MKVTVTYVKSPVVRSGVLCSSFSRYLMMEPLPVVFHTKKFCDTSWVAYSLRQFWHYLPGQRVRPHR